MSIRGEAWWLSMQYELVSVGLVSPVGALPLRAMDGANGAALLEQALALMQ